MGNCISSASLDLAESGVVIAVDQNKLKLAFHDRKKYSRTDQKIIKTLIAIPEDDQE